MVILLTLLFIMSITGSISFFILLIVHKVHSEEIIWVYKNMKMITICFLFPVFMLIVVFFVKYTKGKIFLSNEPDILLTEWEGMYLTISELPSWQMPINIVILFWGIGTVIFLYRMFFKGKKFVNQILDVSEKIQKEDTLQLCEEIKKEIGIKKEIKIFYCPIPVSPFTSGILSPKIFIPNIELEQNELSLILRHELIHIKNNDVFYKQVMVYLRSLYWFNPLIYIYTRKFFELSELVCDRLLIQNFTKEIKLCYARLIIKVLELSQNGTEHAIISAFEDDERSIERRLKEIMKKHPEVVAKKPFLILASIFIIAASPIVSYASTIGILKTENRIVNEEIQKRSIEQDQEIYFAEYSFSEQDVEEIQIDQFLYRGTNRIDVDIKAGKRYWLTMNIGDSGINIVLSADSSSDKFKVGYKDGSNYHYVSSKNGVVNHIFQVNSGTYKVYIENNSTQTIHLSGRIEV